MSISEAASPALSNLSCSVNSKDPLDIRHFHVRERISKLFTVNLVVVTSNHNIDFDKVIGHPARFTMHHDTHERFWSGICSSLEQVAAEEEKNLSTYELTIVPALWFATQRRNYRMFQQISEPDIALKLLEEWEIKPEVKLTATYKKRKYRVQYGESDLTFMSRMLEDAGICFYFKQHEGETKMVLSDAPQSNEIRGKDLPFFDDVTTVKGECVTNVRLGKQVRPGKYTMRDHDYRRPANYKLVASHEAASVDPEKKLERFHYTPGAFLFGTDKGEDTPHADDRGKARTDEREGQTLAQKRLEAKRSNACVITFDTNAPDLSAGSVMKMAGHPRDDLKKPLLIVEVKHSGTPLGEWSHQCEARSAEAAFRPPLVTKKPKVSGVESATVVGPAGEEIHTDEFGRVRVHFHWDRESQMDEKSSCWIHVSQPWGGAGFGGVNLPRVGQEVLVDFLGGDPDRPIITGRVYTNLQKVPYKLPGSKTQSGWKSESSPGGGGFNEIRFEDAKGEEHVFIRAEKDLKKVVQNNEDVTIGNNRTKLVNANDALTVLKNRTKMVQGSEQVKVGQSQGVAVGLHRATQVGAIDSTMVGEMHSVIVSPPGESLPSDPTAATMVHHACSLKLSDESA